MSITGWAVAVLVAIIVLGGAWWYASGRVPQTDAAAAVSVQVQP